MNVDEVYAREKNGKLVMAKSHAWQSWEDLFALKAAIESSGYQSRKDVEGVIRALEGMSLKNSIGHPQGDKIIRKEDHAGILDHYISRVENGRYEVKQRISKEDLLKQLPVRTELNKMPV